MTELIRVRDRETGAEFTTALFLEGAHELLDEPAVDADGTPLPAKPRLLKRERRAAEEAANADQVPEGAESADDPAKSETGSETGAETPPDTGTSGGRTTRTPARGGTTTTPGGN
jgi:hypothetical protein